jgi:hypothetical protein
MVSPVDATCSSHDAGEAAAVPVTKSKSSCPGLGAFDVTLRVDGGLRTESVTVTLAGLLLVGTVSTVTVPE